MTLTKVLQPSLNSLKNDSFTDITLSVKSTYRQYTFVCYSSALVSVNEFGSFRKTKKLAFNKCRKLLKQF